jgi:hypothetical protein
MMFPTKIPKSWSMSRWESKIRSLWVGKFQLLVVPIVNGYVYIYVYVYPDNIPIIHMFKELAFYGDIYILYIYVYIYNHQQ